MRSRSGWARFAADNPRLDARDVDAARQPRRLAFGHGPLPEGSELELLGGSLEEELEGLAAEGVQSLLLEGGPTLAASFLAADLVDKLMLFVAPKLSGDWAGPALGAAGSGHAHAPGRAAGRGGHPPDGLRPRALSLA